jgi:rRNA maturation endonuclease Nob1
VPDDGVTAVEHLAKGIIEVIRAMQENVEYDGVNTMLPCPRCGNYRMHFKAARNAFSRHEPVHVCSICGTDEAVRIYSNCVLPTADWWVVKEILSYKED